MSQTTAPAINMEQGFAGLIADGPQPKDVVSRTNKTGDTPLGHLVVLDLANGDDSVAIPTTFGEIQNSPVGVAMHSHAIESNDSGDAYWPTKSRLNVLRKGRIWVYVHGAVNAGDIAYVRYQNGNEGRFSNSGDADATPVGSGDTKYVTSTTGAGLAVVELNLP